MEAIHIVGAGGIGIAVGHTLASVGVPVVMVDTSEDKIADGKAHGLRVDGRPAQPAQFVSFAEWRPPARAFVLLCTKCPANRTVLARLPASVHLVPIQNGISPELLERRPFVEGIASFVSECLPGQVRTRITRPGRLHLGVHPSDEGDGLTELRRYVLTLASLLRRGPFGLTIVEDIRPIKHTKLLYNAAISPLAAAAGLDNGALLRERPLRELFFALLRENHAILQQAGVPLGQVGPLPTNMVAGILSRPWLADALAWVFAPSLRGTYCSMAGDLGPNGPEHGTEIDNYNGYLIRLAGSFPCPLNRAVTTLIRRMERLRLPPGRERLEELWPILAQVRSATRTTEQPSIPPPQR